MINTKKMAIIDVVKCDMQEGEICWKFPSDNLRIGTQLVVYPAQTAFFVKGGAVCDEFTAGTYTIKSENIPLLHRIINIPFGGDTPFKAEVWFVNQIAKLDLPWGTPHPIQVEDPKYKIIVPVRAHGQYGITVTNPRAFLESMIGNLITFNSDKVESYFKGRLITSFNSIIANQIVEKNVSVLDINSKLMELSIDCEQSLNKQFERYGITISEFSIMSITIPQDDPSVVRLKEAKDLAARLAVTGVGVYQMERSFDVLEKVAGNEGAGGMMATMGAGLGVGFGVGNTVGGMVGNVLNTNPTTPPPVPTGKIYHAVVNGAQIPNLSIQQIEQQVNQGQVSAETLVWTAGMASWMPLSSVPELAHLVNQQTPPPIPNS